MHFSVFLEALNRANIFLLIMSLMGISNNTAK